MKKKKLIAGSLAVVLALALTIGGTISYLQGSTAAVVNTMSTNKVEVSLSETTGSEYNIVPGTSQSKDPTITVDATVASYVFLLVDDDTDGLVTYALESAWTLYSSAEDNGTGSDIYYQAVSAETTSLGIITDNTISYDASLTNADMLDENGNLKTDIALSFKAYAIQQASFDGVDAAYEALKLEILGDAGWIIVDEASDLTTEYVVAEGSYILADDVAISSSYISTAIDTAVTIDLNGYTLDLNGGHIVANGDITIAGEGTITGGSATYGGAIYIVNDATVTLESATITGCETTSSGRGGAVYADGGNFVMNGGTITGNSSKYGGGVCVYDGTFVMNGGTISDNEASYYGGGVELYTGSSSKTAEFEMNGGTITGNTSVKSGGGLYIGSYNTATINGGSITGNTSTGTDYNNYYKTSAGTLTDNTGELTNNTAE